LNTSPRAIRQIGFAGRPSPRSGLEIGKISDFSSIACSPYLPNRTYSKSIRSEKV
jgi:hypothetical protein